MTRATEVRALLEASFVLLLGVACVATVGCHHRVVTLDGEVITGHLAGTHDDAIYLVADDESVVTVPTDEVERVENHGETVAIVGASVLGGGAILMAIGLSGAVESCVETKCDNSVGTGLASAGVILAVGGIVTGVVGLHTMLSQDDRLEAEPAWDIRVRARRSQQGGVDGAELGWLLRF